MGKMNVLVGQSGGPTAVINSSLYGVVTESMKASGQIETVYGMINGVEGFLEGKTTVLSELSQEDLSLLQFTPAAYLGSCRFKMPEDLNDPIYPELFKRFKEKNIGYFLYIGGNDSMDTVSKLSRYGASIGSDIRCIGIPKTIDNDLIITDHCPGYGSAAKYVAITTRQVVLDASVYDKKFVTIIEIMGRHAGWLTAASVLARKHENDNPLLIYMPEVSFSMDTFFADLDEAFKKTNNVVVCVSEGIKDESNTFICEYGASDVETDSFGHKSLAGTASFLADAVKDRYDIKVRSIELSLCQRCAGTEASMTDVTEAAMAGIEGVKAALEGETGKMIAFKRADKSEYEITCQRVDVNEVCNQEKEFPAEWILNGNDIGQEYIDYALPLIQGATKVTYENGLPKFLYRK